jgi:hypothetical protein
MESENLEITTRRITIRYVFRNPGDQDQSVVFAFPLPDIDGMSLCLAPHYLPRRNEVNFVGFTALSNGKPVPMQPELRAVQEGRDVTARVTAAGLSGSVLQDPFNAEMVKIAPEERDKLEAEGLVQTEKFNIPLEVTGKKRGWCPRWTMRVEYSWTQVIPAHQVVEIMQVYSPALGGGYFMPSNDPSAYEASYCAPPETLQAIALMRGQADGGKNPAPLLYEQAIDYTLTSANNWNGPIGIFHLTVLTRDPNDMLMTCFPGLQRTGPGKYELEKDNYRPSQDLRLMILQKTRPWGW